MILFVAESMLQPERAVIVARMEVIALHRIDVSVPADGLVMIAEPLFASVRLRPLFEIS